MRHVFGDPLFTRRLGGVEPTPRALEIGPALHTAIRQLEEALSPPVFDPLTAERRFVLAAGPYACTILVPSLVEHLREAAPGVRLQIEAYGPDYHDNLEAGRIDGAIVSRDGQGVTFKFAPLFTEDMVWVARRGHPLSVGELTDQRLASARRIVTSSYREMVEGPTGVGAAISRRASQPETPMVGVTVPDAFSAVVIATRTDMVALVPRRLAQIAAANGNAVVIEPVKPAEPLHIGVLLHADRLAQPAMIWFAKALKAVAKGI